VVGKGKEGRKRVVGPNWLKIRMGVVKDSAHLSSGKNMNGPFPEVGPR